MIPLLLIVELALLVALAPWFSLLAAVLAAAIWHKLVDRSTIDPTEVPPTRFLIVIPAHDEAGVIGVTVRSCRAVDYPRDQFQVWVIADNCTDATASQARAAGAEVLVRSDLARKSKGYALEDFFDGAATNPAIHPAEAFVLVDADTTVSPNILRAFDLSVRRGDDFAQGYYTVRNADASWRTRLLTYAFSLANGVWLAGTDQLGLSVGLKGNGMCFRAAALSRFPWRVAGLVEDMEYAWALRVAGARVRFQPLAQVQGEMVSRGGAAAASQRQRWESGRRALRSSVRPQLWRSSALSFVQKFIYQTELNFPPLSRLVVGLALVSVLDVGGTWASQGGLVWWVITSVVVASWTVLTTYLLSPLVVMGLPARYLLSLGHLPYYMLWKLVVGRSRQPQEWVRTPREAVAGEPGVGSDPPV